MVMWSVPPAWRKHGPPLSVSAPLHHRKTPQQQRLVPNLVDSRQNIIKVGPAVHPCQHFLLSAQESSTSLTSIVPTILLHPLQVSLMSCAIVSSLLLFSHQLHMHRIFHVFKFSQCGDYFPSSPMLAWDIHQRDCKDKGFSPAQTVLTASFPHDPFPSLLNEVQPHLHQPPI